MTVRTVVTFENQSSVETLSDSFCVNPNREVNVVVHPHGPRVESNATLQVTIDDIENVLADKALWVDSPVGEYREPAAEKIFRPVTAVRLRVDCGKWDIQVRQS